MMPCQRLRISASLVSVILLLACQFWSQTSTCCGVFASSVSEDVICYYAVVIDAGSTGSRSFVYNITESNSTPSETSSRSITSIPRAKVRPGLSTLVHNSTEDIVAYMAPLLIDAAAVIPPSYYKSTQVYIKGTAGMRLLEENEQQYIWRALLEGLNRRDDIPFAIAAQQLGTISGSSEAYYAVLSSNYIEGSIDGDLNPVKDKSMVGALDMGGSSTQLIFFNGSLSSGQAVSEESFWSHSWLNFGVEIIREKVLKHVHNAYVSDLESEDKNNSDVSESDENEEKSLVVLSNPCGQLDHEYIYNERFVLRGTGDGRECVEIIKSVIWPHYPSKSDVENTERSSLPVCEVNGENKACAVDGIVHPPVGNQFFYGMSVYFYAFDCIRHHGPQPLPSWPNPTIQELSEAADQFCSIQWADLQKKFEGDEKHLYTRTMQLPFRCLEALYMVTLLESGFGFSTDKRQITLALEVQGKEVEWTLGFALAEIHYEDTPVEVTSSQLIRDEEVKGKDSMGVVRGVFATIVLRIRALLSLNLRAFFGRLFSWTKNFIRS